jgi:hypothetical protein
MIRRVLARQFRDETIATVRIGELYRQMAQQCTLREHKRLKSLEAPWRLNLEAAFSSTFLQKNKESGPIRAASC